MLTLVCTHVRVYMLTLVCMHVCVTMLTLSCTHVHIHTHQSISECNKDILTQPTPFREKLVLHLLVRHLVYSKLLLHLIFFKTYFTCLYFRDWCRKRQTCPDMEAQETGKEQTPKNVSWWMDVLLWPLMTSWLSGQVQGSQPIQLLGIQTSGLFVNISLFLNGSIIPRKFISSHRHPSNASPQQSRYSAVPAAPSTRGPLSVTPSKCG